MSSEEIYQKKKITIKIEKNRPELYLEGKHVRTHYDEGSDVYITNHIPYKVFQSLTELAKAMVDSKAA